jgi:hypothetical protein
MDMPPLSLRDVLRFVGEVLQVRRTEGAKTPCLGSGPPPAAQPAFDAEASPAAPMEVDVMEVLEGLSRSRKSLSSSTTVRRPFALRRICFRWSAGSKSCEREAEAGEAAAGKVAGGHGSNRHGTAVLRGPGGQGGGDLRIAQGCQAGPRGNGGKKECGFAGIGGGQASSRSITCCCRQERPHGQHGGGLGCPEHHGPGCESLDCRSVADVPACEGRVLPPSSPPVAVASGTGEGQPSIWRPRPLQSRP